MHPESLDNTIQLIKSLLPEFKELLSDIRQGHGFYNFPTQAIEILSKDGLPPWAVFYENHDRMKSLGMRALIGNENFDEFKQGIEGLSDSELASVREDIKSDLLNADLFDQRITEIAVPTEVSHSDTQSETMTDEQKTGLINTYLLMYTTITQITYYLALMSFGKSICALVDAAKQGDDRAFCHAVQIDKTILTDIPYFRKRLLRAQLGSEPMFLHSLALAIKGPILRKKLSFPLLMFVFAVIDDEGFLDLPLDELMEVCEQLGVYGREFGIEDTESLRKRRKYYRDQTGRQIQI
jgi:hypothetical protein